MMQGYSGANETPGKEERMIRHWLKLMVLTLLVFIQTACPKYVAKQNEDAGLNNSRQLRDHG